MINSKTKIDKYCSLLKNFKISSDFEISDKINSTDGEVVVVEIIDADSNYSNIEISSGEILPIKNKDVIACVLGQRKALEGITGKIPQKIKIGDHLEILSRGGVIGKAYSWNQDIIDKPVKVKVLGSIKSKGKSLNIKEFYKLDDLKYKNLKISQVIAIWGTCMNTGKTTVAREIVHILTKNYKFKVNAAKLTGVATQKDLLSMKKAGASNVLSFLDLGLTSTISNNGIVVPAALKILKALSYENPNFIVIEMGDGIIGWYGVDKLLKDNGFMKNVVFNIACAKDLAGSKSMIDIFKSQNQKIDFFAGPVSNNAAGIDYIENIFNIPTQDLRGDKSKLIQHFRLKDIVK